MPVTQISFITSIYMSHLEMSANEIAGKTHYKSVTLTGFMLWIL